MEREVRRMHLNLALSYKPEESMKALIQMGTTGYYPLFHEIWMQDPTFKEKRFQKITGVERARAKKLFHQVSQHKRIEHKKTVLLSMSEEDRRIFMKAFFKLVEGKILDQKPEIH